MFGYRPAMEVNFLLKSFYIMATCLNNLKKNMVMLIDFFPIVGKSFEKRGIFDFFTFLKKGIFIRIYVLAKWRPKNSPPKKRKNTDLDM